MDNKLLDKIKKLLNKADDAADIGSVAEAEAFMAKVGDLLIEHNLSMANIASHSVDKPTDNDIIETGFDNGIEFGDIKSEGGWETNLFSGIAWHYMCDSLYRGKYRTIKNKAGNYSYAGSATIIGTAENVEAVKFVFSYVRDMLRTMSKIAHRDAVGRVRDKFTVSAISASCALDMIAELMMFSGMRPGVLYRAGEDCLQQSGDGRWSVKIPESAGLISYRETWIKSYLSGAVSSVRRTMRRIEDERKKADAVYGLVLANNHKISEYIEKSHPKINMKESRWSSYDSGAYRKGKDDGEKIDIASGIAGSGKATSDMKMINNQN